jgi:Molydopterin dinucleotide binding domain
VPIRRGTVFVPFHYGSRIGDREPSRAANELTATAWDPVSKQPMFKLTAVAASRAGSA